MKGEKEEKNEEKKKRSLREKKKKEMSKREIGREEYGNDVSFHRILVSITLSMTPRGNQRHL